MVLVLSVYMVEEPVSSDPESSSLPAVCSRSGMGAVVAAIARDEGNFEQITSELRGVLTGVKLFRNGLTGETQYTSP